MAIPFAFFNLGPMEIIVILVIGVLLFGRRLPEVGRYLGKGITEFRKGVKGLEDELDTPGPVAGNQPASGAADPIRPPQRVGTTAPKFEDASITPPPREG